MVTPRVNEEGARMFAGVLVYRLSLVLTLGTLLVFDTVKDAETPQEIAAVRIARTSQKWCPPRNSDRSVTAQPRSLES
jgi:hypothetical protein